MEVSPSYITSCHNRRTFVKVWHDYSNMTDQIRTYEGGDKLDDAAVDPTCKWIELFLLSRQLKLRRDLFTFPVFL